MAAGPLHGLSSARAVLSSVVKTLRDQDSIMTRRRRALRFMATTAMSCTALGRCGLSAAVQAQDKAVTFKTIRVDAESVSKNANAGPFEILPDDTITVGTRLF